MHLVVVGLNHRTAPIEVRERLSIPDDKAREILPELVETLPLAEAAVLSTCNRVEIIAAAHDPERAAGALHQWMAHKAGLGLGELRRHLYDHVDEEAVRHVFEVGAGLDSLVLGEPQILGQLKDAYELAKASGTAGHVLHKLFHASFAAAKRARSQTEIGRHPVSIASCAVDLARRIFGDLTGKTVMLIGAGEMAELAAEHLQAAGCREMLIANRTLARAEQLARRFGGHALALDELEAFLDAADIVVSSTGAPRYVITPELVHKALAKRRGLRPLFLIDIAAPRDVDPRVAEIDDVYVYDIDDLEQVATANQKARAKAAEQARMLLQEDVMRFMRWLRSLEAVPLIRAVQEHVRELMELELARARAKYLKELPPEHWPGVERLAEALAKKIMHPALATLKHLPEDQEGDMLMAAAAKLFGVEARLEQGHEDRRREAQ
ncbi:MAG: glutamyl-tRNA reductase [Zetaproteobacteria bacterium]|nr:MAG: glutamyl-tRNA reductase [Zetaproteobacteria bacterium]